MDIVLIAVGCVLMALELMMLANRAGYVYFVVGPRSVLVVAGVIAMLAFWIKSATKMTTNSPEYLDERRRRQSPLERRPEEPQARRCGDPSLSAGERVRGSARKPCQNGRPHAICRTHAGPGPRSTET